MAWALLTYFLAFVLQAALMGCMMFQGMTLSELANHGGNPHDALASLNVIVLPEFGVQAMMTLLMLLTGRWFIAALHLLVLAYNVREVKLQRHFVDVTEVFRDLPRLQTVRNIKLALYVFILLIVMYRLVETAVETLLTPEGRVHAAHIMKQAAADM